MQIKRRKIDSEQELDLLTGLIVSDKFFGDIKPLLDPELLQLSSSRKILSWCVEYFDKYKKAPKDLIQDIYKSKLKYLDEEEEKHIDSFLDSLSDRFEKLDSYDENYYVDLAEKYLAERKVVVLSEKIKALAVTDKTDEAENLIADFHRTEKHSSDSVDILLDKNSIIDALTEEAEPIVSFPGVLGDLIGGIERGDFFSYIGPMKRGKTWWLQDFAVRSMVRQLKVLFVSMEMLRNQMIRRLYQQLLGLPKESGEIHIPYFDDKDIKFDVVKKKGLFSSQAIKKGKAIKKMIKSGGLRLMCRPARSINVQDIKTEIKNLAHYEGFLPDVIVIDYADILKPEQGSSNELRHRLDGTWTALRALAQEFNSVVVTASQSTRDTFKNDVSEESISEDIRKLAHVTHMVALNQSKENKKQSVMRLSVLANRNAEFLTDKEVAVLYNYGIGKAYLDSRWANDINLEKGGEK